MKVKWFGYTGTFAAHIIAYYYNALSGIFADLRFDGELPLQSDDSPATIIEIQYRDKSFSLTRRPNGLLRLYCNGTILIHNRTILERLAYDLGVAIGADADMLSMVPQQFLIPEVILVYTDPDNYLEGNYVKKFMDKNRLYSDYLAKDGQKCLAEYAEAWVKENKPNDRISLATVIEPRNIANGLGTDSF